MSFIKPCMAALVALAISFSAAAAIVDVNGVKIEDTLDLQGSKLQLNGAGIRYRAVFKILHRFLLEAFSIVIRIFNVG